MTATSYSNSRRTLRCIGFFLLVMVLAVSAEAALVRGRLQKADSNGDISLLTDIPVTLYNDANGRSPSVMTDSTGMYYLNVPPGSYRLEVWTAKKPRVFQITVEDPETDIPAITL